MFFGYLPVSIYDASDIAYSGARYVGYRCPKFRQDFEDKVYSYLHAGYVTNYYTAFNQNVAGNSIWLPTPYKKRTDFVVPEKIFLWAEGAGSSQGSIWSITYPSHYTGGLTGSQARPIFRHKSGRNMPVGFVDAHVTIVNVNEVKTPSEGDIRPYDEWGF